MLTFRALGDWVDDTVSAPDAHDHRPVHMRGTIRANRARSPVVIRLEVDGVATEHIFAPKGWQSDGASIGTIRVPVTPGKHHVEVRLVSGPGSAPAVWSGGFVAHRARLVVLTYEPGLGFRLEE